MRKSWSQALFCGEAFEVSFERLARYGYDGVELPLSPLPPVTIRSRLQAHGLTCTSINGRFIGMDRDLSSPDEDRRKAAVGYVKSCIRFAALIEAPVAIIVPTRIGKMRPETTLAEEWRIVIDSLAEIAETGRAHGVTAVIECVNRAESYLCNRLATGRKLVEAVGSPNLRMMADSFHMNIEEVDMLASLRDAAPLIAHVHLADNDRTAPGMGHLDLTGFLRSLNDSHYAGALVMECDIQSPDEYGRMAASTSPAAYDAYALTAITTLHAIEAQFQENHS